MLGYIQTKIGIAYRTRLTNQVLNTYLGTENGEDKVYYKMCMSQIPLAFQLYLTLIVCHEANLDDRIKNPDQMITTDIQRFSAHLAAMYSNLAKPVLDVILYNYQLSRNVGAEGLILLTALVQLSAVLREFISHPCS